MNKFLIWIENVDKYERAEILEKKIRCYGYMDLTDCSSSLCTVTISNFGSGHGESLFTILKDKRI